MKKLIISIFVLLNTFYLFGQIDTIYKISLEEAQKIAYENNLNITNAELEIKKAKWKIWETTAMGLPQVNGQIQFQDFLEIPTQLMPNFMLPVVYGINTQYFGLQPTQPLPESEGKIPVQFGSKYNASWGVNITQLIFNGEYFVGLKTAKIFKDLSIQNKEKAVIELNAAVKESYILCLIAMETEKILDSNYVNLKKLSKQTEEMVKIGMAEDVQLNQIKVLEYTLKSQLTSIKRQKNLAFAMLKFQLGIEQTDSIILTDSLEKFLQNTSLENYSDFEVNENINYKLVKTQEKLSEMDLRRSQSKFLPSISGIYSYSEKAMTDEFNFFDDNSQWYKSSLIGFTVQVPIFGSGQKIAQVKQKQIALLEARNKTDLMKQQLQLQYQQQINNFYNSYDKFLIAKENLKLTEKIYQNTFVKYQNGSASSFELTQSQNQLLEKQASYYQAIYEFLKSQIELEKLISQ